jgi:small nuclear ribonucleoprotein D3
MIGAPVKLLYESKHHVVTVEMKTGEMFRGYLADA